jgi:hypothetical protein
MMSASVCICWSPNIELSSENTKPRTHTSISMADDPKDTPADPGPEDTEVGQGDGGAEAAPKTPDQAAALPSQV